MNPYPTCPITQATNPLPYPPTVEFNLLVIPPADILVPFPPLVSVPHTVLVTFPTKL